MTACAGLLGLYAALAWAAVQTKSPTFDEPYHALAGWVQLHRHDYRMDDEDPPLWLYWASLPNGPAAITADVGSPVWRSVPRQLVNQWYWEAQTLWLTPGNDADALVGRCRGMMLVVAVALGAGVAVAAGRAGGTVAAVVATALFALDPNLLAHGPLMKNDVAAAAAACGLVAAVYAVGRRATVARVAAVSVAAAVALTVKFSGCAAVLLVPLLLAVRAAVPTAWPVPGRAVVTRRGRFAVAAVVTVAAAAAGYAGIWAAYGFRFRPTPDQGVWLNLAELTDQARVNRTALRYGGDVPAGVRPDPAVPLPAAAIVAADRHGLLPQPYLAGLLFTYANSLVRPAYLCGRLSSVGWWWYFPFAIVVKTPVATLAAGAACLAAPFRRWRVQPPPVVTSVRVRGWAVLCLIVPPALLLATAMASHLDIGVRHVLAVYPFAFVGVGWAVSRGWHRRSVRVAAVLGVFLLATESLAAFPDYLPFFNVAAAHAPGGRLALLGDSNLDWGQDLLLLAGWQRDHPRETLYLSYFGGADPASYGIRSVPLAGGYAYGPPPEGLGSAGPGVVAISGSNLQGITQPPALRPWYAAWAARSPRAVLGGSIYLYDWPPLAGRPAAADGGR